MKSGTDHGFLPARRQTRKKPWSVPDLVVAQVRQ
jgi:hypothetical protein